MTRPIVLVLVATSVVFSVGGALGAVSQSKLTASGSTSSFFGTAVASTGTTIIVGSPEDTRSGFQAAGAAYVFVRSGVTWTQQAKLEATDPAAFDFFGSSVSVAGDTAIVGSPLDDNARGVDAGAAYVFVRSGTTWSQQAKLIVADGAAADRAGTSVAVAGQAAVIGAPQDDIASATDAGSASVFVRSGATWSQQAKLTASDPASDDRAGFSVALASETAVVGSYLDNHGGGTDAGSAYVFTRSGSVWSQQGKLVASDGAASDWFGVSVAVSGDTAVVGAYGDDHPGAANAGSAYVFIRSGSVWHLQTKLQAFDGQAGDLFGVSAGLEGNLAVVGASRDDHSGFDDVGSGYVWLRNGSTWTLQEKLLPPDSGTADGFGYSTAMGGGGAVAGAPTDDHSGVSDVGSVYVFDGIGSGNEPPETSITSSPPSVTGPGVTFTFTGFDDITPGASLTFLCALDAASFAACTSPRSYSNLAHGSHLFRVAARDAEGNIDPSPAAFSWTVDRAGPTTTFSTPDHAVLVNAFGTAPLQVTGGAVDDFSVVSEVTVTFTPQDMGSQYSTNTTLTCTAPSKTSCAWQVAPPTRIGRWQVTARARDSRGNVGPIAGPLSIVVVAV